MKKFICLALALVTLLACFASCGPAAGDTKIKVTINVRNIPTADDPEGFFLKTTADFAVEPETKLLAALDILCADRGATYEISTTSGGFLNFTFGGDKLEGDIKKIDENKEEDKSQFVITEFEVSVNGKALKDEEIKDYVLAENDVVDIRLVEGEPFWTKNE